MDFGEKLHMLRKNNNLSQEKLAEILNVDRHCISRIENGQSEPGLTLLKNMANYFKVDIATLVGTEVGGRSSEEKINEIARNCHYLLDKDLDFLIRIISVMREEYVKKG